jgi:amino acid transporter
MLRSASVVRDRSQPSLRPMTDEQPTRPPKRSSRLRRSATPKAEPTPEPSTPRELQGQKPGNRRVRVERPQSQYFRYTPTGALEARPKAHEEKGALARFRATSRHVLFGRALSSSEEIGERLSKVKALAIFSSDAISSSAYATEEILRVLIVAGAVAFTLSLEVAIAIAILLAVVSTSYRQIGYAYPNGGGAYAVAKENLGRWASLIAASALLVDYVLTVAVSTSSAVAQITSALPNLLPWTVPMGVLFIVLMALGNLRGMRESGNIFALPTYLFVGTALLMIGLGLYQIVFLGAGAEAVDPVPGAPSPLQAVTILLLLRAFASGSVALTGVEAVANGVPAFKRPESRNAATTLTVMAVLLGILFVGITYLADHFAIAPSADVTVVSEVAGTVFGDGSLGFYLFQTFTALILILAANTSFAAFPRLAAILAEDYFFPRNFAYRGDRLAYTAGIIVLAGVAALLLIAFRGDVHALIPLYSVGVFLAFTLSQSGMVRHWWHDRLSGWRWRLSINAIGALMTATVLVVVLISKAPQSLLVAVIIPIIVAAMWFIHREYDTSAAELHIDRDRVFTRTEKRTRVIVPIPNISRSVVRAVQIGLAMSDDVRAVHITIDSESTDQLRKDWEHMLPGVPLVVIETPYRSLVVPFLHYLDVMAPSSPDTVTVVVLPEYVPRHWYDRFLHNQKAERIGQALVGRHNTVVVEVPYAAERERENGEP